MHLGLESDADFNWFEAAQLLLSAIVVPILAKLGDMFGHKRMLLISTALTAAASWWLAARRRLHSFLIAWALQGFYSGLAAARGRADLRPRPPRRDGRVADPARGRTARGRARGRRHRRRARRRPPCSRPFGGNVTLTLVGAGDRGDAWSSS